MYQAITMIEAQNMLTSLKISDWPNMKDGDRDRLHKSLFDSGYFTSTDEGMTMTNALAYLKGIAHGR